MGLLDDVFNAATGGQSQSGGSLLGHVLDMIQNHPGGVSGMVQSLNNGGLGSAVTSWISTGQNLPVTADQIESALGSGPIANLAAKAGISPEQAKAAISQLLPQVIDKLSPNGQLPQGGLLENALSMLRNKG
jgi:uncharacterized protein YidB (DUF937 family)